MALPASGRSVTFLTVNCRPRQERLPGANLADSVLQGQSEFRRARGELSISKARLPGRKVR